MENPAEGNSWEGTAVLPSLMHRTALEEHRVSLFLSAGDGRREDASVHRNSPTRPNNRRDQAPQDAESIIPRLEGVSSAASSRRPRAKPGRDPSLLHPHPSPRGPHRAAHSGNPNPTQPALTTHQAKSQKPIFIHPSPAASSLRIRILFFGSHHRQRGYFEEIAEESESWVWAAVG